jgi:DNA-binding transcriptional LysR family regulator
VPAVRADQQVGGQVRSMLPTPYAERIRGEVHQLVTRAEAVFTPTADIDPATLERTFTLRCNDVIAGALVPRLTARLLARTPGVCLRVLGEAGTNVDQLRGGDVDIALTAELTHPADVSSALVLTDHLGTVARADLPSDPTTPAGFAALPHVVISRRGRRRSAIDDLLEARGLRRHVAVTVPTLAMALRVVADGPLVTVAPTLLTRDRLGPDLRRFALPVPTPEIPAVLAWHTRHERDAAHRWLRETISDTLASIAVSPDNRAG